MTSGAASFNSSLPGLGTSAAVRLTRVSRHWAGVTALDNVSIDVQPDSFTVLLGPSGCGKTTCLRIIAGRDVTRLPPAARGVAMVFQSYALFPHLTVAENIVFGLKARRVPSAERTRRLDRAVEILGVGALLHRKPSRSPAASSNVSHWVAPSSPKRRCA
jgi:sn-glycerol 3-phosphate transport system ATP-binding protein